MSDRSNETEEMLQQVESHADEAIQSAMVKTAIRTSLEGSPADEKAALSDVLDHMAMRKDPDYPSDAGRNP